MHWMIVLGALCAGAPLVAAQAWSEPSGPDVTKFGEIFLFCCRQNTRACGPLVHFLCICMAETVSVSENIAPHACTLCATPRLPSHCVA